MLQLIPFAVFVVATYLRQECSNECRCSSCHSRFGMDVSGKRGPALWDSERREASLKEEAEEGHVFASVSPSG